MSIMENFDLILDKNKDVLERMGKDQVRFNPDVRRIFVTDEEMATLSDDQIARKMKAKGVVKMEDGSLIVEI